MGMIDPAKITSRKELPVDLGQLQVFTWELILRFQKLTEQHNKLLRDMYGRKSEKIDKARLDAEQLELEGLLETIMQAKEMMEMHRQESVVIVPAHTRRKHPGRNAIPEELIVEKIIDVPEEEKKCSCCGGKMTEIDRKSHVVIERIPATYTGTRFVRPVYACPHCKDKPAVAEPPAATPISKGIAGPQLLCFVILSKYLYHLPLYRIQRQIFHESAIWFTRSTLMSWVKGVSGILERIYKALLREYQNSRVKHADETPFSVKINDTYTKGFMWVGLSGDWRTAVFRYDHHRSGAAAHRLLHGSRAGDYLMIDDCPSYNMPIKNLKLLDMRCMVHIRRNFIEARDAGYHVEYNTKILIKIGQLYRIERVATRQKCTPHQRGELRSRLSAVVMTQIKALLENPGFTILPGSRTGGAIRYFLNNWEESSRFLQSGDLPIDNSVVERIIRSFAIGRNNWIASGSENGAQWTAILYSIITTCKLNGIDMEEYLCDVLMRLPCRDTGVDISDLTPIGWYKARNGGCMPEVKSLYPSKN